MRVLLIAGRTARHAWTPGGLVLEVARGLVERGHAVALAAQSIDDAAAFATLGCDPVVARSPFNQTATDWPAGFPRWARSRRGRIAHDVCLSLSRTVAGDVWMPVEPSALAWWARARRSHGPQGLAIALARHHGFLRSALADLALVAPRPGPIWRACAVGALGAGEASRLLHRVRGLGERTVALPAFAPTAPLPPERRAEARARARSVFGVGPERRVIVLSAPAPVGGQLDGLLRAVGDLAPREGPRGPLLLALCRDAYALSVRARRAGAADHVRAVSLTGEPALALAAADLAALPLRARRGPFEAGATSRFAADALAAGLPLLALSGAGGYDLARTRSATQDEPGLVVDYPTRESWMRAFRVALDDAWIARASAAAAAVGATLTRAAFMDALEGVLQDAAAERGRGEE